MDQSSTPPVITEVHEEPMPVIKEHPSASGHASQSDPQMDDPWAAVDEAASAPGGYPSPPPVPNPSFTPMPPSANAAAPATQAARTLLEGVNETAAGRRLRRQQARAQRKGAQGVCWGQAPPLRSPFNFQLPAYLRQIGSQEGERSVMVLDSRDQRLQSPYQGWP